MPIEDARKRQCRSAGFSGFGGRPRIARGEHDVDHADGANRSLFDQGARLSGHRESGVAMREAKDAVVITYEFHQLLRLRQVARHWLFANDVDASFEKRFCNRKMELGRSRDDNRIDPVGTRRLALDHRSPVRIGTVRRKQLGLGGSQSDFRVHRHRPGN